ncbi:hypothetical protein GUJ93_ZPchr0003g18462 [Zizania palustris]|uniref:Uncharacterized protein n=1 Tax=Zizania palustris TaxID=103762 RepID=A0A8J5VY71_ZIZPA|nr:hypothetical protein GUJ93_ZPchr0003g18462 [Zizania palustris]
MSWLHRRRTASDGGYKSENGTTLAMAPAVCRSYSSTACPSRVAPAVQESIDALKDVATVDVVDQDCTICLD